MRLRSTITATPSCCFCVPCLNVGALERQAEALYDRTQPSFVEDDTQRDRALEPVNEAQAEIARRIYPISTLTHEGLIAKLRLFVIYDKEIIKEGGGMPGDIVLASALLGTPLADRRQLVASRSGAPTGCRADPRLRPARRQPPRLQQ